MNCFLLSLSRCVCFSNSWDLFKGIAGWHSIHAQEQGLIGISMTNTSPILCPTRSMEAALGTNPISVAAPAKNGDSHVLGKRMQIVETKECDDFQL